MTESGFNMTLREPMSVNWILQSPDTLVFPLSQNPIGKVIFKRFCCQIPRFQSFPRFLRGEVLQFILKDTQVIHNQRDAHIMMQPSQQTFFMADN